MDKLYTVYRNHQGDIELVSDEFSWLFFLFAPIALLVSGMFRAFYVFAALMSVVTMLALLIPSTLYILITFYLTFSLYCGIIHDQLKHEKFLRLNYRVVDVLRAGSVDEAQRFYCVVDYSS